MSQSKPDRLSFLKLRAWVVISFLVGFVLLGGLFTELVRHENVQRPGYDDHPVWSMLTAGLVAGVPGGLISLAITALFRAVFLWSEKEGWWRPGGQINDPDQSDPSDAKRS